MSAFSWIFSWIKNHFKKIHNPCCEQFNIGTNFLLSNYTQQLYQSAEESIHPPFRRGSWVQQRDITAKFFKCVFWNFFPHERKLLSAAPLLKKESPQKVVPHIWFARFALPDTTVKEFVSIPGIKLGIFCLLGECAKSSPIYILYI